MYAYIYIYICLYVNVFIYVSRPHVWSIHHPVMYREIHLYIFLDMYTYLSVMYTCSYIYICRPNISIHHPTHQSTMTANTQGAHNYVCTFKIVLLHV